MSMRPAIRDDHDSHSPYKREMLVYAISSLLCEAKTQMRNASKGIIGTFCATEVLYVNSS